MSDSVPRFDPAPLYWPAMWLGETAIAAGFAAYWWPSHRVTSLALIAAAIVFTVTGVFSYCRVNRSDLMRARRELFTVLRSMPPAAGWVHRGEHLMLARDVTGIPGFRTVSILQADENDIAESVCADQVHTAVHRFTAYPFTNRVYHDMHPVTIADGEGGTVTFPKPDAGAWRQFRRRTQMERKGFAHMPAADVRALAALLRDTEPLGPPGRTRP